MSGPQAQAFYTKRVKLSARICNWVAALRVDHPMLDRPFVYAKTNAVNQLIKETLTHRRQLVKRFPDLRKDFGLILDRKGNLANIHELKEDLWTEEFYKELEEQQEGRQISRYNSSNALSVTGNSAA